MPDTYGFEPRQTAVGTGAGLASDALFTHAGPATQAVAIPNQGGTGFTVVVGDAEDEDGNQYSGSEVRAARTAASITIRISALPPLNKTARIPWHVT